MNGLQGIIHPLSEVPPCSCKERGQIIAGQVFEAHPGVPAHSQNLCPGLIFFGPIPIHPLKGCGKAHLIMGVENQGGDLLFQELLQYHPHAKGFA